MISANLQTAQYDQFVTDTWRGDMHPRSMSDLFIMSTGLGGESGEVLEHLKKFVRDDKVPNKDELVKELGDVLFYLTAIANTFGSCLGEVMLRNVAKLEERYGPTPVNRKKGGGVDSQLDPAK